MEFFRRVSRIEQKLDMALRQIFRLRLQQEAQMATWEEVRAELARQTTVTESVLVFVADMRARMVDAGVPDDVLADLDANTDKLVDAIKENTDAEGEEVDTSFPKPSPGIEPVVPNEDEVF